MPTTRQSTKAQEPEVPKPEAKKRGRPRKADVEARKTKEEKDAEAQLTETGPGAKANATAETPRLYPVLPVDDGPEIIASNGADRPKRGRKKKPWQSEEQGKSDADSGADAESAAAPEQSSKAAAELSEESLPQTRPSKAQTPGKTQPPAKTPTPAKNHTPAKATPKPKAKKNAGAGGANGANGANSNTRANGPSAHTTNAANGTPLISHKRRHSDSEGESPAKRARVEPPRSPSKAAPVVPAPGRQKQQAATKSNDNRYKELEARFSQLQKLRETDAEAALRTHKEVSAKQIAVSEQLIRELTRKLTEKVETPAVPVRPSGPSETEQELNAIIEELQTELEQLSEQLQATVNENEVLQAKLNSSDFDIDSSVEALHFAGDLTGLHVTEVVVNDDESRVYECVQVGKNGAFKYSLTVGQAESDSITYDPHLDDIDDETLALFPTYFSEPLSFTKESAAQFFSKIFQALQRR